MKHYFDPKLSWNSDSDNILEDFYKPALSKCKKYDRLAGYFSSTSLVITAYETLDFIERGGIIRLVTGVEFSQQDADILEKSIDEKNTIFKNALEDFEKSNDIQKKCIALFGWLLSNYIDGKPQLDIKIAVPKNGKIFHPKVGIMNLEDGETISFSGSINETGNAWKGNIEEFKVFKSWNDDISKNVIDHDKKMFEKFYTDNAEHVTVYDIPDVIREHMIKIRPKSTEEFKQLVIELKKDLYKTESKIHLRPYQNNAISLWEENDFKGIFEMATGTGKTLTALGCIHKLENKKKRLVVVIAAPQKHIVEQWVDNVIDWNLKMPSSNRISDKIIKAFSDNPKWKIDLKSAIFNFNKKTFSDKYLTNDLIIYTTHRTMHSSEFIKNICQIDGDVLLVADEVHGTGAIGTSLGLHEKYNYRLGLSATPIRHYDDIGSKKITSYFDGIVYKFTIQEAIKKGYLVPYYYYPSYVELNSDELDEYAKLTVKIAAKYAKRSKSSNTITESEETYMMNYEIERSNLIANAMQKFDRLKDILDEKKNNLKDTLIYCHDRQLEQVTKILSDRKISNDSITWEDPTHDRKLILKSMTNRHHDCITAIKCLDEGVDIPSASMAIMMASTGNPRQYIQRRGRILRPSPTTNKTHAEIYDILVRTSMPKNKIIVKYEKKLVARELLRHKEFAEISVNKNFAFKKIKETAKIFDINLDKLSSEYIQML